MLRNYSLDSLLAFEAIGRLHSFSKAASELGLSQPTISYRVSKLETTMHTVLFERGSGSVRMTPSGQRLYAKIQPVLDSLSKALESEVNTTRVEQISLTSSPAFASIWLLPRLHDFQDTYPDIEVSIVATDRVLDLTHEVDLAIRPNTHSRTRSGPNMMIVPLFSDQQFAVCSPSILPQHDTGEDPSTILNRLTKPVLLHDEFTTGWQNYLTDIGYDASELKNGPIFSNADLTLRAAVSGMGVTLTRSSYAEEYFRSGALVKLPLPEVKAEFDNVLLCRKATYAHKPVRRFVDWLQRMTANSVG